VNKDVVLAVRDMSIRYSNTGVSVGKVSFAIKRGKVLGLFGESGSGKSSVCNAVLGLLDSTAAHVFGSVLLQGNEILPLSWDKRGKVNGKEIGVVMQSPMTAFNPCMKIKGHFTETLRAHLTCSKRDAILYGIELLKKVGLHNGRTVMNSYPYALSGGMLQRVMIALAVSLNPVLIIADEPTTALDTANRELVVELLSLVMKEYRPAMLLVSHDLELVNALADDVAVMKDGLIVERGAKAELLRHPRNHYTEELLQSNRILGVTDCWKS
jgi:ABC-type dipeptide/oligopeptide/nickel transport system ATPase component